MKRVGRARFEIELLVPSARILIFRMHDQRPNSSDVGGLCGPEQGVFEKGFADA